MAKEKRTVNEEAHRAEDAITQAPEQARAEVETPPVTTNQWSGITNYMCPEPGCEFASLSVEHLQGHFLDRHGRVLADDRIPKGEAPSA